MTELRGTGTGAITPLRAQLGEWVMAGLLEPEQAERIERWTAERTGSSPHPRAEPSSRTESLLREALAYVGGALVLGAGVVLAGQYWDDLALPGRAGLLGAVWLVLLGAGARIGSSRAGGARPGAPRRARHVLWALATAALAGLLAVLAADGLDLRGEDVALAVSGGAALQAVVLWWVERSTAQHLVLLATVVATAGSATAQLTIGSPAMGLGLWATAVTWAALSWNGYLAPRATGLRAGAAVALYAALVITFEADWGHAVTVATAIAVVALAVVLRDLPLLAIGTIGTLVLLPTAVNVLWPSALGPPLALLAAGAVALGAALLGWRRGD